MVSRESLKLAFGVRFPARLPLRFRLVGKPSGSEPDERRSNRRAAASSLKIDLRSHRGVWSPRFPVTEQITGSNPVGTAIGRMTRLEGRLSPKQVLASSNLARPAKLLDWDQ